MYVEQEPAPDRSPVPELGEKEREERERMRMEVERAVEVLGYVEDGKLVSLPFFLKKKAYVLG